MKYRYVIWLIAINCLFSLFAFAQDAASEGQAANTPYPKIAIKIDEFGAVGDCELSAKIDNFMIELMGEPTATGNIIIYKNAGALPGNRGEHKTMLQRIARAMSFRNYDSARVVFIEGGFRSNFSIEFWVVPQFAAPPEPSDTVSEPKLVNTKTYLFDRNPLYFDDDEFTLASIKEIREAEEREREKEEQQERENDPVYQNRLEQESEASAENYEEMSEMEASDNPETMDEELAEIERQEMEEARFHWANISFCDELSSLEGSRGKMIFYADEQYYDITKVRSFIDDGKKRIADACRIKTERIEIVFGGYRDDSEIEFWVVPHKAKEPLPNPTERKPKTVDAAKGF